MKEAIMHAMRLARVVVVVALAACDPTVQVVTGLSRDGGAAQHRLAFTVQPGGAAAGDIMTPAILVAAQDTLGNTDQTFTGNVTIALGFNPSGGLLGGTKTVAAAFGVASFGDLSVDRVGSGYTLVASAAGARSAASVGFSIVAP
jgi:hypothetical protein